MNSVGDEGGRTGQFHGPHGIALSKDSKVFSQNGRSPSILKFCCTIFTSGSMSMWTMTLRMLLVGEIAMCLCSTYLEHHHVEGQRKDNIGTPIQDHH